MDVFDEQITRQIKKLSGKTDLAETQPTRLQHIGKKVVDLLKADIANFTFKKNVQEQQPGLITRLNRFNQRYAAAINQIMTVAQAIKDAVLVEKITAFQAQLQHQPFKVVLVGEIKHGKSSLFNAILRQEFSPTGESVATTASVVELSYAKHPQYEGVWMNEEEVNKIRKYIQENQNSLEIRRFSEDFERLLRSESYRPGETFTHIDSLEDVKNYASDACPLAQIVKKIKIMLPAEIVENGVIIIDTPGINDPKHVRDFITLQESLLGDCIVFVMRADKFGTESERKFLEHLIEKGRVVQLLLVITHIDQISQKETIVEKAQQWLSSVSPKMSEIKLRGIFPMNTQQAMTTRYQETYDFTQDFSGFAEFWQTLTDVVATSNNYDEYEKKIAQKYEELKQLTEQHCHDFLEHYEQTLPDEMIVEKLRDQTQKFKQLAEMYKNQIRSRLLSEKDHLTNSYKNFQSDFIEMKEQIIIELTAAIETKVRELGEEYAKSDKWTEFDKRYAHDIIRRHLDRFYNKWVQEFELWKRKIQRFNEELEETMTTDLQSLYAARTDWVAICQTNSGLALMMNRVDQAMAIIENFTKGYVIGGIAVGIGAGNLMAFSSIVSFLVGGNLLIPLGVAVAAFVGLKLVRDPEKRKQAFIQKKLEVARKNIESAFSNVEDEGKIAFEEIGKKFAFIAESKYTPIIQVALMEGYETQLQLKVIERLHQDGRKLVETLLSEIG